MFASASRPISSLHPTGFTSMNEDKGSSAAELFRVSIAISVFSTTPFAILAYLALLGSELEYGMDKRAIALRILLYWFAAILAMCGLCSAIGLTFRALSRAWARLFPGPLPGVSRVGASGSHWECP